MPLVFIIPSIKTAYKDFLRFLRRSCGLCSPKQGKHKKKAKGTGGHKQIKVIVKHHVFQLV